MHYKTIMATINYYIQYLKYVNFIIYSCFKVLCTEILIHINGSINYSLDIFIIIMEVKRMVHTHTRTSKPLHV